MTASLYELFELEQLDANLYRSQFNRENFLGSLFGGQVLSQALMACYLTQGPQDSACLPHSLHAYFLRAGKSDSAVIYDVEKVRDGRSISSRRAVARQNGRPIFNMSASFHKLEDGYHHQSAFPAGIPTPESLLKRAREANSEKPKEPRRVLPLTEHSPFELLPIEADLFTSNRVREPEAFCWFRAVEPLPKNKILQYCALAYASDMGLLATSLLPHGISLFSGKIFAASIDHAMWFHSDQFSTEEWLLVHAYSPWAGGARGFARSSIYTEAGTLIASTAQEGLIRPITP
ncbi:acyl-CoA thioesterase [Teredinibacter waterburyi]|uniref:acyl-CoA thioesterase n=1 Tax=Teredinibacter waterburyi TaxID=1500538 RepID=UPI00165FD0D3|nr:acyl-CoA thioesterase II [Teredinibacter waterburyi]